MGSYKKYASINRYQLLLLLLAIMQRESGESGPGCGFGVGAGHVKHRYTAFVKTETDYKELERNPEWKMKQRFRLSLMNFWDYIKLESYYIARETANKTKK